MKYKICLIALITFTLNANSININSHKDKFLKNEVQELIIRGGLPNFFSKISKGDSIKVAYLGGSITNQPGWRVYSLEWFKQRFPNVKFAEINAAISGTGSDFGVFRLKEHVLKFKPDLVFVEFAVNDASASATKITRSMEGIVRQIWQQNPRTDICFIYTIKDGYLETEQNGQLPTSAQTMETVADKYAIPSINFGYEVSKMVSNKQLIFKGKTQIIDSVKVFSSDGVHPYPEVGHIIYNEVIKRSFETMAKEKYAAAQKHSLGKSLRSDYFSNTQMVDLSEGKLSANWEVKMISENKSFASFGKLVKQYAKSKLSGETLTVKFKGVAIGIYDILGPGVGKVQVEVDGVLKDTYTRFDKYCTYWRMNYFLIDGLENKTHTVVFKALSEPFDKEKILKEKDNVMKNPADYVENNWYVCKIMIDGEVIK